MTAIIFSFALITNQGSAVADSQSIKEVTVDLLGSIDFGHD